MEHTTYQLFPIWKRLMPPPTDYLSGTMPRAKEYSGAGGGFLSGMSKEVTEASVETPTQHLRACHRRCRAGCNGRTLEQSYLSKGPSTPMTDTRLDCNLRCLAATRVDFSLMLSQRRNMIRLDAL